MVLISCHESILVLFVLSQCKVANSNIKLYLILYLLSQSRNKANTSLSNLILQKKSYIKYQKKCLDSSEAVQPWTWAYNLQILSLSALWSSLNKFKHSRSGIENPLSWFLYLLIPLNRGWQIFCRSPKVFKRIWRSIICVSSSNNFLTTRGCLEKLSRRRRSTSGLRCFSVAYLHFIFS